MGYRNDYKEHFVSLAILMFLAFAYSKTTNGEIPEIKNREKTIDTLNAHQMPDILYIKFYNNIALNVRSAEPVWFKFISFKFLIKKHIKASKNITNCNWLEWCSL